VFPEQWIGRSGPTAWPARSPDLNPLDFHLRRHTKSTAYAAEVSDVQGLQQRIQNGFEMIRTIPGIFRRVTKSVFRRATFKLKSDTLNIVFNFQKAGTRKPCCRRPFLIYFFLVLLCNLTVCRFGRAFFVHPMQCVCVYIRTRTVRNSLRTKRTSTRIRKSKR
jgi:hypothetical protein